MFNSRSLRNKTQELSDLLNSELYDIICVTETWLTPTDCIAAQLYSVYRHDRTNGAGGGVCILTKNSTISASAVKISDIFSDIEITAVDVLNAKVAVRVINIYRPPSSDTDSNAILVMKRLIECLHILCEVNATIIITGDLNLPFIDWSNPLVFL